MVDAPLRILHVIDTLEVGGAQRHVLSLIDALHARGHRCLIATSGARQVAGCDETAIYSLARDSISHRLPLRFAARLIRVLAEERVDLVHAHLHASALAAAAATAVHRLPLVMTHHSDSTWQPPYHQVLGRWAASRARMNIAVARGLATQPAVAGLPTLLIPNGVPLPPDPSIDREQMRGALGLPPRALIVGFTGRFVADKGPLLFVEMAARVAARNQCAHFLMVGGGPLQGEIERRIAQHGLGSRFTLAGVRNDASRLYSAADVAVVPSRRDACPLVPLEAMAAGCPVVGTAVGDMPEQIVDGITGSIVPVGDIASLAAAVLALVDPTRRWQFGQAGRERVAERYSIRQMADRTMAIYEAMLRAGEGSGAAVYRAEGTPGSRTGGRERSMRSRRGSSHGGSFRWDPSVSSDSSVVKPGGSVAISKMTPPGSLK